MLILTAREAESRARRRDVVRRVWAVVVAPVDAGSPLPPPADDLGADGGPIGALFGIVYGEVEEKDVFERERSRILQAVARD